MKKLIGPSSPEEDGDYIGEYYGRTLTQEEIRNYMYADESDVKTGFMIIFQGLAVDAWDHEKGCYSCMSALLNDVLDASRYNAEWVKRKANGRWGIWTKTTEDIHPNEEGFIEYGNLSFCRTGLPLHTLFKAVTHYWNQIMSSPEDREYWSRIPQARTLFNSPYHTCKPSQRELIATRVQLHYNSCTDDNCTCHLQQFLTEVKKSHQKPTAKSKAKTKKGKTSRHFSKQEPCIHIYDSPPLTIALPNPTNQVYDEKTVVKPADDLPGAGLGLYATAVFVRGDVVGIYENASGGQRRTMQRIKDPANQSQYAVEHEGLIRDAWDEVNERPCCNSGYINDYHDASKDNVQLGIHPLHPNKLLVIATKVILGSRDLPVPFSMPYGGYFWCDDCHSFELQCQAIRRYNINIHTSTNDTDGDWTLLHNYSRLCEVFPRLPVTLPLTRQCPVPTTITTIPSSNEQLSTVVISSLSSKRKAKEPDPASDDSSSSVAPPSKLRNRDARRSTMSSSKRKAKTADPTPKDSRQRTMHAYVTASKQDGRTELIPMAPRLDCNVMHDSSVNDIACMSSVSCHDFLTSLSSPIPTPSSLAILNPELSHIDSRSSTLDSQLISMCNEEDTPLDQGSVAPAVCPPPASTILSDSHMEYDKKLVFS